MNATDIIAWAHEDGFLICTDCVESTKDLNPVFANQEFDQAPTCDSCQKVIEDAVVIGAVS